MTAGRGGDPDGTRPTRVVPWSAVIGLLSALCVMFAGAFAAFWVSTVEQNGITRTEIRHLTQNVQEMKDEQRQTNATLSAKSAKDSEQDARILDLDRRVTRMESR